MGSRGILYQLAGTRIPMVIRVRDFQHSDFIRSRCVEADADEEEEDEKILHK